MADGNRPEKSPKKLEESSDPEIDSLEEGEEEMTVVLPDELESDDGIDTFELPPEPESAPARGVGLKSSLGSFRETERVPRSETLALTDEDILGTSEEKGPGERQPTRSLDPSGERVAPPEAPFVDDLDREDTEEVFVILPEQLDSDIPMVDTEVVAEFEDGDFDGDTEVVAGVTDTIQSEYDVDGPTEIAHDEDYEGPTEFAHEGDYDGPTERVDANDLDQLTSDLDDEALVDGAEPYDDEFSFSDEPLVSAPSRGRFFAAIAAIAVVAITAGYFVWDRLYGPELVAETISTIPDPHVAVDVRELLRERLDLAISRGFEGEVSE